MLDSQINIGKLDLKSPFILAPLAGFSDLPFRILCREYGAGLCYSEMISTHGLVYGQKSTVDITDTVPAERPVAMQLFGSDPGKMAEAAAILSEKQIDLIDINMGCPVKKVVKKGAGAALMKAPKLASVLIEKAVASSKVPVTVKIRLGWTHQNINVIEFAKMAEDSGATAITVHGRTWSDGFSGQANWDIIAQVKQAVSVPVIGNGDIHSYEEGLDKMRRSGCDAVMIGRAALGKPWIFSKDIPISPALNVRITALKRHLELLRQFRNVDKTLARIKNQAGRYFKGVKGGAAIRNSIYGVRSYGELIQMLDEIESSTECAKAY